MEINCVVLVKKKLLIWNLMIGIIIIIYFKMHYNIIRMN